MKCKPKKPVLKIRTIPTKRVKSGLQAGIAVPNVAGREALKARCRRPGFPDVRAPAA